MNAEEKRAWLELALTPYVGAETFLRLLKYFGSAQAALNAPLRDVLPHCAAKRQAVEAAWRSTQARQAAEDALAWEDKLADARLLTLADDDYPPLLGEGLTPPPLLFVRGDVRTLHSPALAVVGSRHATPQALRIARDFAAELARQGAVVVSGMADGIDTAAHEGALAGGGQTVAVWGTGIDRVYPARNRGLAGEIVRHGCVVSEFPLGTRPVAGNFPRRNRLIAALSAGVLVVEAATESGSLITARLAAEMGREVMAVPGSIDNPLSKGCHALIKQGAKLVENLEDIVSECPSLLQNPAAQPFAADQSAVPVRQPEKISGQGLSVPNRTGGTGRNPPSAENDAAGQPYPVAGSVAEERFQAAADRPAATVGGTAALSTAAQDIVRQMGFDPVHPDELAAVLGMTAADVYAEMVVLELDGWIAPLAGGRFQRIKS